MSKSHKPESGKTSGNFVANITSVHPAIIFVTSAGVVTVVGCFFVLAAWLIVGPDSKSGTKIAQVASAQPAPVVAADDLAAIRSKLHEVVVGMHAYQDAMRMLPVQAAGKRGSGLSWRVHLLPYLGKKDLYEQFNLDEPWDGPANSKLLDSMPDCYRCAAVEKSDTRIQIFTGPDSLFTGDGPKSLKDVKDGIGNTILIAVTKPSRATPWTKPDELTIAGDASNESLGTIPGGTIEAVTCDGKSVSLPYDVAPDTLKGLITPNGKEIVDAGKFRTQSGSAKTDVVIGEAQPGGGGAVGGSSQIKEKMAKILLGLARYHDAHRQFPVSTKNLSWRVQILPFIDQGPLYEQFHQDERWDSPHNQALVQHMPDVFRTEAPTNTATRFHILVGENTLFAPAAKPRMASAEDGRSNTLLVVHAGEDRAISWTSPVDIPFDVNNPSLAPFGITKSKTIVCGMMDRKVVEIPHDVDPKGFAAIVTPNGKEVVDVESLSRGSASQTPSTGRNATASAGSSTGYDPNDSRREMQDMKKIILALHNYNDTHRQFPVSTSVAKHFDKQDKPLVSWRVHLLRYIDQEPLYQQFKLDEPWDSPTNKPLLEKMPSLYRSAKDPPNSTTTRIMLMTGPGTVFEKQGPTMVDISDGTSETLLCIQVAEDRAVSWTKPDDAVFDPENPLAALGSIPPFGLVFARADGAVFRLAPTVSPDVFRAIVTRSGGESLTPAQKKELGFR